MDEMIERVAKAIDAIQIWSRFNDWTSDRVEGLPVEICRYGGEGEAEIVVLRRLSAVKDVGDALREVVSEMRGRAAIEAMREPTKSMIVAGESVLVGTDAPNYVSGSIFNAMIDAALATPPAEDEKPAPV